MAIIGTPLDESRVCVGWNWLNLVDKSDRSLILVLVEKHLQQINQRGLT